MGKLTPFLDAKQLDFQDLQAVIAEYEAELKPPGDGHTCEVHAVCRLARGLKRPCGFAIAGTVQGCPKRRGFSGSEPHEGRPGGDVSASKIGP